MRLTPANSDGLSHVHLSVADAPHAGHAQTAESAALGYLAADMRYVAEMVEDGTISPAWIRHYLPGWLAIAERGKTP